MPNHDPDPSHEQKPQQSRIIYPSRLNGETNLAIYDRAVRKLRSTAHGPLLKEAKLATVLRDLRVGLQ